MIAYHVDRGHLLEAGQVIELCTFPNQPQHINVLAHNLALKGFTELSRFGMNMISGKWEDVKNVTSGTIEDLFESYRLLFRPDAPSRLQSLFAVKQLSDLELWRHVFGKETNGAPIWKVECDSSSVFEFDARYLEGGFLSSFDVNLKNAQKYWTGAFSRNPLPELLLPLPVKVVCVISEY